MLGGSVGDRASGESKGAGGTCPEKAGQVATLAESAGASAVQTLAAPQLGHAYCTPRPKGGAGRPC